MQINGTFLKLKTLQKSDKMASFKGQLISKCLYEIMVWTKIPTKTSKRHFEINWPLEEWVENASSRAKPSQDEPSYHLLEQASARPSLAWIHRLWLYQLWSFTFGDTKSIKPLAEVFQMILWYILKWNDKSHIK